MLQVKVETLNGLWSTIHCRRKREASLSPKWMFTNNVDFNGNVMLQSNGSDRKLNGGDHMPSFASSNGVDYPKEFSNVAHPMEPVDLDQPIRCPPPEPCIMHVCNPPLSQTYFELILIFNCGTLSPQVWAFRPCKLASSFVVMIKLRLKIFTKCAVIH